MHVVLVLWILTLQSQLASAYSLARYITSAAHRRALLDLFRTKNDLERRAAPVLPAGWSYLGCRGEPTPNRILSVRVVGSSTGAVTQGSCVALCAASGYIYAGMEYSYECWCVPSVLLL